MRNERIFKLVEGLIHELLQAVDLINRMNNADFVRESVRSGSVGAQFRHNLDFLNCFLTGAQEGIVDYERRERDPLVETDKTYAAAKFALAIEKVELLSSEEPEKILLVRSEIDPSALHTSTVSRELEFVLSHTIHHHALVAEKLEANGTAAPRNFGVAPSTLKYWKSTPVSRSVTGATT